MAVIEFTIPGRIGGKGRPKFARRGNFVTAYTPEKTRNAESMVRDFAAMAMRGTAPMSGALHLGILISLNRPNSWSKRKCTENPIPTGKPDLDNIAKLVGDSLNGICWKDDSQIASLDVARRFQDEQGESTAITVRELAVSAA